MKILYANLMFQLPDDFAGTYPDALRLAANYSDQMAAANNDVSPNYAEQDAVMLSSDDRQVTREAAAIMQRLFESVQAAGRKMVNSCFLAEWNEGDSDWTYYDYDGKKKTGVEQ